MVEYNINPQIAYNWVITLYVFFTGLSAGIYFFSIIANYWKQEFKSMVQKSSIITPIVLLTGMFLLFIEIGKPFRIWRLFFTFNPTSSISWGSWFVTIFLILSSLYAWFLHKKEDDKAKKVGLIGLIFAFFATTYTGILFSQKAGKVIWHTSLLPWKFLAGGIISGLALLIIVFTYYKVKTELLSKLGKIISGLLILELGLVLTEMLLLFTGNAEAVHAAKEITAGSFGFLFWFFEIICGSFIPIYIFLKVKPNPRIQIIASSLTIMGIYMMRHIIIYGGQVIR